MSADRTHRTHRTELPHRLAEMTTLECARAVTAKPVVVVPLGAHEQHGPGLPMSTDIVRAERVADLLAERLDAVVVGPGIPLGVSPHHLSFAGTLSLSTTTFAAVVREYLVGLHRHGWRKVLVLTGHGGNDATLGTVAQDLLVDLPDLELAVSGLTGLAADVVAELGPSEVHGHSGEAETAQMLHLAPELVHRDRLRPGTTRLDQLDALPRLSRQRAPRLSVGWERLSDDGVLGDPTRVTPADGGAIVEAVLERLTHYVKTWLDT